MNKCKIYLFLARFGIWNPLFHYNKPYNKKLIPLNLKIIIKHVEKALLGYWKDFVNILSVFNKKRAHHLLQG